MSRLQSLIANVVKAQLGGGSHKTHLYTKPYTKRIDALRVPRGYQAPKFNQFGGKRNPKQHIGHFIETCNNSSTMGDRLVKQFVVPLKELHLTGIPTLPLSPLIVEAKWSRSS